jgi:hypothetical protein
MAERKKYPTINTPNGTFKWPKLTSVDYGTKEFPNKDGSYNLKLVMTHEEAAPLIEAIQPYYDEALEMAKREFSDLKIETRKKLEKKNGKTGLQVNPLYTEIYDKETEEPTGEVEFGFKMKASGVRRDGSRWTRVPGIFDAKGQTFPKGIDIWGGTVGKIAFKPNPYWIPGTGLTGCGLGLEAVQVLELVSAGNRSADSFGFGAEEGSCDGSTLEVPAKQPTGAMGEDAVDTAEADADGGNF